MTTAQVAPRRNDAEPSIFSPPGIPLCDFQVSVLGNLCNKIKADIRCNASGKKRASQRSREIAF